MSSQPTYDESVQYDLILIGAGSASCLIASRVSQQLPHHQILILEAGEHVCDDAKVQTPGLAWQLQGDPHYDWQHRSMPEPGLNGRTIKHPRGKLVGGTSANNSHSVVYPNHEWQDRMAEMLLPDSGKADWNSEGMQQCYQRWQVGEIDPGAKDNLDHVKTSYPRVEDFLQAQWIKTFRELGHEPDATGFGKSSTGAVTITNAVDQSKGERSHAGTAFLESALKRGNVTLRTGAQVNKIEFDETLTADHKLVARGVRYVSQGKEYLVSGRDIVLSAGVFGSPTILEQSGIGAKAILDAANIPILYELPGVGENLQDHLNCGLSFEVRDDIATRDGAVLDEEEPKAALLEYETTHAGRMSEGAAYSFAFTPLQMLETISETQELIQLVRHWLDEEPDKSLQAQYAVIRKAIEEPDEATATTFMVRMQRNTDLDSLPKGTPPNIDGKFMTIVAMLAHPFSRGSCHISPETSDRPEIEFNYLSHPLDAEILARHLRLIDRLFDQPTYSAVARPNGRRIPRSHPFPISSLEIAKEILPINAATNYHPSSTCAMMKEDLRGVVDEHLKVYGTANVRVCDASVLPLIPRGNILVAVYAFAEKAAEIICREIEPKI